MHTHNAPFVRPFVGEREKEERYLTSGTTDRPTDSGLVSDERAAASAMSNRIGFGPTSNR